MYDIIIIGSGPSGSTLARYLNKDLKVLIMDRRNLKESDNFKNEKPCGGLLAPDAQKALAELNLGVPNYILTGPQVFSVKTYDFDNNLERYYQRHYININRELFDRWLFSLVPSNVDIKTETIFKGFVEEDELINVEYIEKGIAKKVQTKILVGADGATSKVRRDMKFKRDKIKTYAAIQKWYGIDGKLSSYYAFFDRRVSDYYSWAIQKDKYLLIGSAIEKGKDINKRFELFEETLISEGFKLDNHIKSEGTMIQRPKKTRDIKLIKGNTALIGESAGLISPSSAEGISYALMSGKYLADSINKSFENFGRVYKRKIFKFRIKLVEKRLKSIVIYNAWVRKIILRLGIGSINNGK
ncbi:MAG: FAD-binding protein [Candidatus Izimaplasma sp.]|nr:FAD-binding protein [Candidatus Izimaplasma bacterium]